MKNNKLSWGLVTFILMLIEYIVFNWTYEYGSDSNLINQISFAGTIVSIILAVLAIIYSFVQSEGQKNDSNRIATQISSLETVVKEIDMSKVKFVSELERLEHISKKIDSVNELLESQKTETVAVRTIVQDLYNDSFNKPNKENTNLNGLDKFLSEGRVVRLLMYTFKLIGNDSVDINDFIREKFSYPLAEVEKEGANSSQSTSFFEAKWGGATVVLLALLQNFSLLQLKNGKLTVSKELLQKVDSIIDVEKLNKDYPKEVERLSKLYSKV